MKPAVAGMPASASIEIVIGHASHGRWRPESRDRGDRVAQVGFPLARHDHGERGHVHEQVHGQVEHGRLHAELGGDDDAGEHVSGLCHRGVGEHPLQRGLPERADVADEDRDRREHRDRRSPAGLRADQRNVEEAQEHSQRRDLGGDRHECGDRRRRALVDVGRPLVEGRHRGLEATGPRRTARCPSASAGRSRGCRCDSASRSPRSRSRPVAP